MNEKQKAFVREYIKDFNATRAAERAGYKHPHQQGARLLSNVGVQGELARLTGKAENKAVLTYEEACVILSSVARACPTDYADEVGNLDINRGDKHGLQEVTQLQDKAGNPILKVKLHSKIQALERLSKMLGWDAPTKLEHTGDVDLSITPPPAAENVTPQSTD